MLNTLVLNAQFVHKAVENGYPSLFTRGWYRRNLLSCGGYQAFLEKVHKNRRAVVFLRSLRADKEYSLHFNSSIVVFEDGTAYPLAWLWVGMMMQDWQVNQFLEGELPSEAGTVANVMAMYQQFIVVHVGIWSMRKQLIRSARGYLR